MGTFRGWLTTQLQRSDKVGDFARTYTADIQLPHSDAFQDIAEYLGAHGGGERVLDALRQAYGEWLQGGKMG